MPVAVAAFQIQIVQVLYRSVALNRRTVSCSRDLAILVLPLQSLSLLFL